MGVPPRPTALAGARFLGGHARSGSRSTLELAGVDSSLAGASRRGPLAHCDICGCVRWGLGVVACWALLGLPRRETLARLLALVDLLVARLVGGWKHGDRPSVVEGSASSAELSAGATIRATQEHTLGGWELSRHRGAPAGAGSLGGSTMPGERFHPRSRRPVFGAARME